MQENHIQDIKIFLHVDIKSKQDKNLDVAIRFYLNSLCLFPQ